MGDWKSTIDRIDGLMIITDNEHVYTRQGSVTPGYNLAQITGRVQKVKAIVLSSKSLNLESLSWY